MMPRVISLLLFTLFLSFGCSSSEKDFKTLYDSEYEVLDRGGSDVIVKSKACSIFVPDAISEAKRSVEYKLRSVIGNKNFRKKFQEIKRYHYNNKVCVEIIGIGLPPL